jgi:hypothetical protein
MNLKGQRPAIVVVALSGTLVRIGGVLMLTAVLSRF